MSAATRDRASMHTQQLPTHVRRTCNLSALQVVPLAVPRLLMPEAAATVVAMGAL